MEFLKKLSLKNPISILLAGLMLQRLPSLFVPFWTKDEGFWWAVGKSVANGGRLFVEGVDNKPTLFLGAYAAAIQIFGDVGSMVALHALVIISQAIILMVVYKLSLKYWGEKIALAVGVMYICLQGSFISQEILAANSENLMMPFLMVSLYLYDKWKESDQKWLFGVIGLLIGIGFFVRQTAVVFFLFFALQEVVIGRKFWRPLIQGLWMIVGFGIFFGIICLWHYQQGSFNEFWYWTFSVTREYVDESLPLKIILWDGFWKTGTIFLAQAFVWFLALKTFKIKSLMSHRESIWIIFFLTMALIVSAGWRFSHHYYLQIFPAVALLAGQTLSEKSRWTFSKKIIALCLCIPLLGFTGEALYRCVKDREGFPRPAIRELGLWLDTHKSENESLFIWGYYPEIYYYSGLKNAARFVEIHFLTGQIRDSIQAGALGSQNRLWDWLWSDLQSHPPTWVVDNTLFPVSGRYLSPLKNYPELQSFVETNYQLEKELYGMKIFKKKSD